MSTDTAEQTELQHAFGRFFDDFALYLDSWNNSRREADRYLAAGFNIFALLQPDEAALRRLFAELLDPEGSHGQDNRFAEALERMSDLPITADSPLPDDFCASEDCRHWLEHCVRIADADRLRWVLRDLHDWLEKRA